MIGASTKPTAEAIGRVRVSSGEGVSNKLENTVKIDMKLKCPAGGVVV